MLALLQFIHQRKALINWKYTLSCVIYFRNSNPAQVCLPDRDSQNVDHSPQTPKLVCPSHVDLQEMDLALHTPQGIVK